MLALEERVRVQRGEGEREGEEGEEEGEEGSIGLRVPHLHCSPHLLLSSTC